MENVPWHEEVVDFVQQLAQLLSPDYAIASEHAHSNCVLLAHTKVRSGFIFSLPLPEEGGYVFTSACLSVCVLDYSNGYERILIIISLRGGVRP